MYGAGVLAAAEADARKFHWKQAAALLFFKYMLRKEVSIKSRDYLEWFFLCINQETMFFEVLSPARNISSNVKSLVSWSTLCESQRLSTFRPPGICLRRTTWMNSWRKIFGAWTYSSYEVLIPASELEFLLEHETLSLFYEYIACKLQEMWISWRFPQNTIGYRWKLANCAARRTRVLSEYLSFKCTSTANCTT